MTTSVSPPPPPELKLKLSRARKQLRDLRRTLERYVASNPCSYRRDVNEEGTHYLYRLLVAPAPDQVALIADEAVHHLRSLLDHLITAMIEARGKSANGRRFPIFDVEPITLKDRQRFEGCIDGVTDWAHDLIVSLQPYKRGDAANTHPLWILNRLNNRLKHTSLELFALRVGAPDVPGVVRRLEGTMLQSGDIFAEAPINLNVEEDFEPYISAQIAFRPARVGVTGVDLDTLDEIHDFVRDEVLRKLVKARFAPRLRR